jgi:adenylate kinase
LGAGLRLVLLGPPGAGKGTQAKLLQQQFEACQISTGDILREAIAAKTPLGDEAAAYIKRGALVPDDVIVGLVAERLKAKDCENGFLLDGFPRTISQAESLGEILKARGLTLDGVIAIEVPQKLLVERLAGRRTCKGCGAPFHTVFDPPKAAAICDRCGGELHQREDDREETIRARLQVYENQTAPLVTFYRERGLLKAVDGVGSVAEIYDRIVKALGKRVT